MKRILLLLLLFTPLFCNSNKTDEINQVKMVYVCTGSKSVAYHKTSRCKGLNKCSGTIKRVSLDKAKSMRRRPCKICY